MKIILVQMDAHMPPEYALVVNEDVLDETVAKLKEYASDTYEVIVRDADDLNYVLEELRGVNTWEP